MVLSILKNTSRSYKKSSKTLKQKQVPIIQYHFYNSEWQVRCFRQSWQVVTNNQYHLILIIKEKKQYKLSYLPFLQVIQSSKISFEFCFRNIQLWLLYQRFSFNIYYSSEIFYEIKLLDKFDPYTSAELPVCQIKIEIWVILDRTHLCFIHVMWF